MKQLILFGLALLVGSALLSGCGSPAKVESIVPVGEGGAATLGSPTSASKSNPEPSPIFLPTPLIQVATNGHFQDDNGLRLAVAGIASKAIPNSLDDDLGWQYVIVKISLNNYSDAPKDVTGFPFTVWITESVTKEEFIPEVYAPYTEGLWDAIEKLTPRTGKMLKQNQTIHGEFFFKAPVGAQNFTLMWRPDARRQWALQLPKVP